MKLYLINSFNKNKKKSLKMNLNVNKIKAFDK